MSRISGGRVDDDSTCQESMEVESTASTRPDIDSTCHRLDLPSRMTMRMSFSPARRGKRGGTSESTLLLDETRAMGTCSVLLGLWKPGEVDYVQTISIISSRVGRLTRARLCRPLLAIARVVSTRVARLHSASRLDHDCAMLQHQHSSRTAGFAGFVDSFRWLVPAGWVRRQFPLAHSRWLIPAGCIRQLPTQLAVFVDSSRTA